jgi:hypothetical protein
LLNAPRTEPYVRLSRIRLARRELGLEAAITKLDKYQLLILDNIAYVT